MIIDWEHHCLPEELVLKKGGKIGEKSTLYEYGKPRGDPMNIKTFIENIRKLDIDEERK